MRLLRFAEAGTPAPLCRTERLPPSSATRRWAREPGCSAYPTPQCLVPSIIPSDTFLSACQRRLGLYLTALDDVYNALEERGVTVTQHQRLGDHCLNSANATHRHNAALAAVHRALTSVTSDALPVGSIQLADKGDGTPASKAERKGYYAHVNKGHIPDLIRFGSTTTCWEFKCY